MKQSVLEYKKLLEQKGLLVEFAIVKRLTQHKLCFSGIVDDERRNFFSRFVFFFTYIGNSTAVYGVF